MTLRTLVNSLLSLLYRRHSKDGSSHRTEYSSQNSTIQAMLLAPEKKTKKEALLLLELRKIKNSLGRSEQEYYIRTRIL